MIMMPNPMDSEKKIWPYAAAHTGPVSADPVWGEERVQPVARARQQQCLHDEGGEGQRPAPG